MVNQVIKGKAFEYACLMAVYMYLSKSQKVEIEKTTALKVAANFYNNLDIIEKNKMDLSANAAVRIISRLEPQLENPFSNTPLILSIQDDAMGIAGDVRDILCIRRQNNWEIGLSCKHNHTAVKHSRLSPTIDFGKHWFGIPCSTNYFTSISPLFNELKSMKEQNMLWRQISNKEERFYIPLLEAFITELKYLEQNYPEIIPNKLLQYLLGVKDFYKIITNINEKVTQIQVFNLYGTLNKNAGNIKPQTKVQQLQLPTRFFDISFKPNSKNTIHISCDKGWGISLRIHSASSKVEPSLKFDIKLIGIPPTLYIHHEPW